MTEGRILGMSAERRVDLRVRRALMLICAAASVTVVSGAVVSIAATEHKDRAVYHRTVVVHRTSKKPTRHRPAHVAVAQEALAGFAVFRRSDAAPDGPASIADAAPSSAKIDPSSVRLASTADSNKTYLMTGPSQVCMRVMYVNGSRSLGCALASTAADGLHPMADVTVLDDHTTRVTVLLPDGTSSVFLRPDNGVRKDLVLMKNVAAATMDAANGVLGWTTADGTSHTMRLLAAG